MQVIMAQPRLTQLLDYSVEMPWDYSLAYINFPQNLEPFCAFAGNETDSNLDLNGNSLGLL